MTGIPRSVWAAMICAAAVVAQFVGSKATRDALFLTSLDVTTLPLMLMATAGFSVVVVMAHARISHRFAPAVLVPALFAASGALYFVEWLCRPLAPSSTAIVLYLHVSIAGPLLTSGFWLLVSESFNPRAAKTGFGYIAAGGTLGGLAGALVAERVATLAGVPVMLPLLGGSQFVTAWLVRRLSGGTPTPRVSDQASARPVADETRRSPPRIIAEAPHLRILVVLLLLGATSAALLDYVFKASAAETFGFGDSLLRFFAAYYAATSIVAFVLQTTASRAILERFGLGLTTSAPSIALLAGSVTGLIVPGFGSIVVARAGEAIFRASWFRAGYELFYTPVPPAEKRAVKPLIDVGVERLGDAAGGALVALITFIGPTLPMSWIVWVAMAVSVGAIVSAAQVNRWYVRTLERSLVDQGGEIDLAPTVDHDGASILRRMREARSAATSLTRAETIAVAPSPGRDNAILADIRALQSNNPARILRVLARDEGLRSGVVAHVIPLLAIDTLADYAVFALRKIAEERAGELTDALLDANQPVIVRRRLAEVFSVCVSQRAADCLLLALDDRRFEVRYQAARSLAAMVDKNPQLRFDRERIFASVLQEAVISRPIWEGRRLLDGASTVAPRDAFIRQRARQSLAHVFTLLSLTLPREALQIAYRGLQGQDRRLRGTALEYLESVLPSGIRSVIWPYLVDRIDPDPGSSGLKSTVISPRNRIERERAGGARQAGDREAAIGGLLRNSPSQTVQSMAGDWEVQPVAGFQTV